MIVGDPNRLAIGWDFIPAWNLGKSYPMEGGYLIIDAQIVGRVRFASVDISRNIKNILDKKKWHAKQSGALFLNGKPEMIYADLYNYTYNQGNLEDAWEYRAEPEAISDLGGSMFLVKDYAENQEVLYFGVDPEYQGGVNLAIDEYINLAGLALGKLRAC